jgi:hypothetical protein
MLATSALANTEPSVADAARLLPDTIADFRAQRPAAPLTGDLIEGMSQAAGAVSAAIRTYNNEQGATFSVTAIRTEKDSAAYALLTRLAPASESIKTGEIGIANVTVPGRILFCKGEASVEIKPATASVSSQEQLISFAQAFARSLPNGDDDIPVLVKHLPDGQTSRHPSYVVSLDGLRVVSGNQPILSTLNFEGGTEAAAANYGQSQLVIVEFTTPQLSLDNDQRIWTRIGELKSQGQPVPSAYRRVGNYSVFVFNAPDEKSANELIDQVKYQQVVQWLGEDPHLYEKLERYFAQTSAGVLIAVLESSGISLLVCLGLGALLGTLLFRYRRAQRATRYSDAGGTVRLNLDELTGNDDSRSLLK